jgi:hypothetical protein
VILTKVKIKAIPIESKIVGYKLKKGKIKICISKANINPDPTSIILSISCCTYPHIRSEINLFGYHFFYQNRLHQ